MSTTAKQIAIRLKIRLPLLPFNKLFTNFANALSAGWRRTIGSTRFGLHNIVMFQTMAASGKYQIWKIVSIDNQEVIKFTSTGTLASFQAQDLNSSDESFSRMRNNPAHIYRHRFVDMIHKWICIDRRTICCLFWQVWLVERHHWFWLNCLHTLNAMKGHIRYMNWVVPGCQAVLSTLFQGIQRMTKSEEKKKSRIKSKSSLMWS